MVVDNILNLTRKKLLILLYKLSTNKKLSYKEENIIRLIEDQVPKKFNIK